MRKLICLVSLVFLVATANAAVVEYHFNETSGNVAADSSGNGNNGALVNFPVDDSQWITGSVGGALDCDGVDDYVNIGAPVTGDHTYTLIFNVKGYSSLGSTNTIYSESVVGTTANLCVRASFGKIQLYSMDNSYGKMFDIMSAGTVFDNTWHEVMLANDYGKVTFYIDGVVDSTQTYDPTAFAFKAPDISHLGAFSNSAGTKSSFYGGQMDTFTALDTAIPEPATLGLLGLGALILRRRKSRI